MNPPVTGRRRSRLSVVGVAVVALATAAACSSSGTSGGSVPSTQSSGPSSGRTAGASAGVARAKADVAAHLATPAKISVSTPLKSKPPTGKTLVYMQCELPQCALEGSGLQAAARALGWTYKAVDFKTTQPPSLISGMQQALQYKPVAVTVAGEDQSIWQSEIAKYQAAGVTILPFNAGPITLSKTVPAEVADPTDWANAGKLLGDWFVADSNGTGDAVFLDVSAFDVLKEFTDAAEAEIESLCPKCTVTNLDASLTQVANNQVVPAVVSAVQRSSSVDYVLAADGPFVTGLASSLKTIGRSNVKIAGGDPDITNEQNLVAGTEQAWVGQAYEELGWQVVDAVARKLEGMSVPKADGGWPLQLITKANVGTPSNSLNAPTNFEAQFKKLWHVG